MNIAIFRNVMWCDSLVDNGASKQHSSYIRTDQPMARVSKLARGIHCCHFFLVRPASVYCEEYVYTYAYLTAHRLYAA